MLPLEGILDSDIGINTDSLEPEAVGAVVDIGLGTVVVVLLGAEGGIEDGATVGLDVGSAVAEGRDDGIEEGAAVGLSVEVHGVGPAVAEGSSEGAMVAIVLLLNLTSHDPKDSLCRI